MNPRQQTPQEFNEAYLAGQETTWWMPENQIEPTEEDEELNLDKQ